MMKALTTPVTLFESGEARISRSYGVQATMALGSMTVPCQKLYEPATLHEGLCHVSDALFTSSERQRQLAA
jgi:hypothetical protein